MVPLETVRRERKEVCANTVLCIFVSHGVKINNSETYLCVYWSWTNKLMDIGDWELGFLLSEKEDKDTY